MQRVRGEKSHQHGAWSWKQPSRLVLSFGCISEVPDLNAHTWNAGTSGAGGGAHRCLTPASGLSA